MNEEEAQEKDQRLLHSSFIIQHIQHCLFTPA